MPRTISADGRTVMVPDDATDEEINQIFGPAPAPQGDLGQHTQSLMDRLTTITPDSSRMSPVERGANFVGNIGAAGMGLLAHPVRSAQSAFASVMPQALIDASHKAAGPNAPPDPYASTPNPIQGMYQGLRDEPVDTAASLLGQSAVLDAAGTLGPKVAGPALDYTGRGLKATAGKIADITAVGSDALDRQFGAKPGRAISESRIIGATKAGLKRKVDATIGPLAAERRSVLNASQAPPVDVRPDVDQPFADLTAKVTGNTGVAAPAEIASLTRSRAAAGFRQDPITGKPLMDPTTGLPVDRNMVMSPADIADFNSGLRGMGTYEAQSSPLADQAIKSAGHNLRNRLAQVAPESVDLTRQIYNAESASDVLQRGLRGSGAPNLSPYSIYNPQFGIVANTVGPVARLGGTTAAALMDTLGSAFRSIGKDLNPPGPPPAGAGRPQQAPPAGQLPATAGPTGPQQPPVVPPPTAPGVGPAPAPAGALPSNAGMSMQVPPASAPPNVSLTERVAPRPGESLTQQPPRPGQPSPAPGTGGLQGPESRVTTRTPRGFGPKVEAPGFTIPKKQLAAPKGGEGPNAVQEPKAASVPWHKDPDLGKASLINPTDVYHATKPKFEGKIEQEGLVPKARGKGNSPKDADIYNDPRLFFSTSERGASDYSPRGAIYKTTLPAKSEVQFDTRPTQVSRGPRSDTEDLHISRPIPRSLLEKVKGGQGAVQEPKAASVLPREQGQAGGAGGKRGGVGPSEQGQKPAGGGPQTGSLASKAKAAARADEIIAARKRGGKK